MDSKYVLLAHSPLGYNKACLFLMWQQQNSKGEVITVIIIISTVFSPFATWAETSASTRDAKIRDEDLFSCLCVRYHQQGLQLSEINLLTLQDAFQDHQPPLQQFLRAARRLNQQHIGKKSLFDLCQRGLITVCSQEVKQGV